MTYPEPDPQRTRALPNQDPVYQDPAYREQRPPPQQPQQEPVVRQEETAHSQAKRARTVRKVCAAITFVCAFFAVVLAVQIILVLASANPENGVASFVDGFSSAVSLGFDGLFTPDSAKAAVVFNYGAAAIVWLLISAALTYLIRRFAMPGTRGTE